MLDMSALPLHPTMRDPRTGDPLRALWVRPDGRACYPMMGGAPADGEGGEGGDGGSGSGGAGDGADKGGADKGGAGGSGATGGGSDTGNATDSQGRDLGFPKDTPVAQMTDGQAAAYWRNESKKHQGRYDNLTAGRSFDDVKKDLDEHAQLKQEQLTPAEKALTESYEKGKAEALTAARGETAAAIFRGVLEAAELPEDDVEELVANFNVANYVSDAGIDTAKITGFAKRFTKAGTADQQQQRRRDFGGGRRPEGNAPRGADGKAEAARRFGNQNKS